MLDHVCPSKALLLTRRPAGEERDVRRRHAKARSVSSKWIKGHSRPRPCYSNNSTNRNTWPRSTSCRSCAKSPQQLSFRSVFAYADAWTRRSRGNCQEQLLQEASFFSFAGGRRRQRLALHKPGGAATCRSGARARGQSSCLPRSEHVAVCRVQEAREELKKVPELQALL